MDKVYKYIRLVGTSDKSYTDAIKVALKRTSKTIKHLSWFEVVEHRGGIKDGKIEHQVILRVAFEVEDVKG